MLIAPLSANTLAKVRNLGHLDLAVYHPVLLFPILRLQESVRKCGSRRCKT
jgi:hypothetical protein